MNLDTLLKNAQTGDLVLCRGKSLGSWLIKYLSKSKYSHIVFIFRDDSELKIIQATPKNKLVDLRLKRKIKGVQINSLEDFVRNYDGELYHRSLEGEKYNLNKLYECVLHHHQKPYENNYIELLRAAFFKAINFCTLCNKETLKFIFCSELIAEFYQEMAVLDHSRPSNTYTPKSFSSENEELQLKSGHELKKEIKIN